MRSWAPDGRSVYFLARVSVARSDYEDFYSALVSPKHQIRWYLFIHLGGERHCESKVSCPRTQHNVLGQDSFQSSAH